MGSGGGTVQSTGPLGQRVLHTSYAGDDALSRRNLLRASLLSYSALTYKKERASYILSYKKERASAPRSLSPITIPLRTSHAALIYSSEKLRPRRRPGRSDRAIS